MSEANTEITKEIEINKEESFESLQKNFACLQADLESLKKEKEEEKEKFLRIIADYENKMKRVQIDAVNIANSTIATLIEDLSPILEDLENAHNIAEKDTKEGISLILKNVKKVLSKYGVEEIIPKIGEVFDANQHQAVSCKESALESGSIIEIIRNGYKLNNKMIAPAIVITSI